MPQDFSCHFYKRADCWLRMCLIAEEYIQLQWILRQQNGYYTYLDGLLIDACHPGRLKRAIDAKFKERDIPPHLTRTTTTFTKLSLFVKATQVEEEELVWGAIAKLENEKEEVGGLVMIRVQERKEVEKGTDKRRKGREWLANKSKKKRTREYSSLYTVKSYKLQIQRYYLRPCIEY